MMVMLNGNKEMFTATEVAHLLNVHINTVRRWSNQGVLKTYRIGPRGDRRFSKEDLAKFLNLDDNHNRNGNGHGNGNGHSDSNGNSHTDVEVTIPPMKLDN